MSKKSSDQPQRVRGQASNALPTIYENSSRPPTPEQPAVPAKPSTKPHSRPAHAAAKASLSLSPSKGPTVTGSGLPKPKPKAGQSSGKRPSYQPATTVPNSRKKPPQVQQPSASSLQARATAAGRGKGTQAPKAQSSQKVCAQITSSWGWGINAMVGGRSRDEKENGRDVTIVG
ncbi:hypothetical protein CTheo_7969 [Ceratobasidium theobromae]|uniref:Uncharacterized protein n=1 Tax=Ceratobasidium theobromae TaxID=1582974 RepID=A0A5N5QAD4_9AGAM|nr:hypothetical protein CTheo_7969 [Ceratobasidium theobromae]